MLGYDLQKDVIAIGDTAKLRAYLLNDEGSLWDPYDLVSVGFNIQAPDSTRNAYQGVLQEDGTGLLNYNDTVLAGHYVAVASFILADGSQKSTKTNFEVGDPFLEPLLFPTTPVEFVAQGVWNCIEDCFDATDGGPWLREMTLRFFNPSRMASFIEEAIFDFNMNQPPTQFDLDTFAMPYGDKINPLLPLIIKGTFLAVIRHLMRSYVEQPNAVGAQFGWQDRRDYQARWQEIYKIETEVYKRWVSMAKRGQFGFGLTSQSLYSYSRGLYSPNFNRTRGFGYWGPGY